ncbi:MAG: hypothetical protein Q8M29_15930 [Bacteroidota bacterium]|nr:hypothetical protein [Bacteroidota bacterium]
MVRLLFIVCIIIAQSGCTGDTEKVVETTSIADSLPIVTDTTTKQVTLNEGLEMFSNIEQIDYCVPIPLSEYVRDTKNDYERAKFVFVNKKNDQLELVLQGMFRSDPKVSIEEYFKNSYPPEDEEGGKNIETKEIVKSTGCFYAKGFWSNFALDQKFIEVTWLRKDDLVKLYVSYDIQDTTIWNNRLKKITETDSYCK